MNNLAFLPRRLRHLRPRLGVVTLTLLVAMFIIGVDNVTFWQRLAAASKVGSLAGVGFTVATAVLLVAVVALVLLVFSIRWVYKPVLIFMLLLAAVIGYFMQTYGVVIDDTMIRNTLDTDTGEAQGLFNAALVWHVLLAGILPSLFVASVRIRRARWWREGLKRVVLAVVLILAGGGALASHYKSFALTLRAHRELRMELNPSYALFSAVKLARSHARAADQPLIPIGTDAHRSAGAQTETRPKILIVVVGETTRAANWGLDGYSRQTTPELAATPDLINFDDAHSCGTSTAISVPCMFSARGHAHFDADTAAHTENLLDVLHRAGVAVRWEENQAGGCKGVCDRVPTQAMQADGICKAGACQDDIFLRGLADRLSGIDQDTVIVMHTMGSHGPDYYERYPEAFDFYQPFCRSNRPEDCSRQALVNSYDNTVRYIDHVLGSLIHALAAQQDHADTALLYLSDHGESLGENGIYLHGFPYAFAPEEQTHIPMILWLSGDWRRDDGLPASCLAEQGHERVSQDNVFSTVLGLMAVQTKVYDPTRDITARCRS